MHVFARNHFADWQKDEFGGKKRKEKKSYRNSQKQLLCPNREENIGNL